MSHLNTSVLDEIDYKSWAPLRIRITAAFIYAWSILRNRSVSLEDATIRALERDPVGRILLEKQGEVSLLSRTAFHQAGREHVHSIAMMDMVNMAVEREKMISELRLEVAALKKLQRT